jgi:hypothetical protein
MGGFINPAQQAQLNAQDKQRQQQEQAKQDQANRNAPRPMKGNQKKEESPQRKDDYSL